MAKWVIVEKFTARNWKSRYHVQDILCSGDCYLSKPILTDVKPILEVNKVDGKLIP